MKTNEHLAPPSRLEFRTVAGAEDGGGGRGVGGTGRSVGSADVVTY